MSRLMRFRLTAIACGLLAASCGRSSTVPCLGLPAITVAPTSLALVVGQTGDLSMSITCHANLGAVHWETTDSTVAAITPSATTRVVVTGRRAGTAAIKAWPLLDPISVRTVAVQVTAP